MKLSDYDLRQLDEKVIHSLSPDAVQNLAVKLLDDLKDSRERLNQNSQNSSKPPSSQAPWDKASTHTDNNDVDNDDESSEPLTEDEALTAAVQTGVDDSSADSESEKDGNASVLKNTQDSSTDELTRKAGKQPGAQGFGRTQKIPVHKHQEHHPSECACCSRTFGTVESSVAYTAFDTLDIEWENPENPGLMVVNTRHTYFETECYCGHITRAAPFRLPPDHEFSGVALSEWRLVGASFASLIVCLCKRMRLSRARIREFLEDWVGVTLSVGTINNTIHEAGRAAMPVEELLIEEVLKSELLHIDETSWFQKGELFWLWAFISTSVVLFKISKRTSYVFQELIIKRRFAGWIMTDGYRVYRQYQKRLRCWAHLTRKAQGLKEALSDEAQNFGEKTLILMNELIKVIKEARESPPDIPLPIAYQQPLEEYQQLCEEMRQSEHEKTHALAVEMLNDWDAIFAVLKHPQLPLTNNEAERALRHWVILRKISYGTRTEVGSRVFAILASVIETCRIRQCSPWRYLSDVIANRRAGLLVPPLPVKVLGV